MYKIMSHWTFQDLHAKNPTIYPQPEINGLLEFEWSLYIEDKKKVWVEVVIFAYNA